MRGTSIQYKWPNVMLMSAATSARLVYDITSATEPPRQAPVTLQHALTACALCAVIG